VFVNQLMEIMDELSGKPPVSLTEIKVNSIEKNKVLIKSLAIDKVIDVFYRIYNTLEYYKPNKAKPVT